MERTGDEIRQKLFRSRVGVIGFGTSGKHITAALTKLQIRPIVFERKGKEELEEHELIEKLTKEHKVDFVFNYSREDLKKADVLILSSGVKSDEFEGFDFLSEMDFVCSFLKDYIFITGTKGKGTTLLFTGAIFRRAGIDHFLGGNIGEGEFYAPSARAIEFRDKLAIFEVSSFQLRSTRFASPVVHAITNLGIDHLDWHPNIQDYWFSKTKMCENAKACVCPAEIKDVVRKFRDDIFVIEENLVVKEGMIEYKSGIAFKFEIERFFELFPGKHNLKNLLVSLGIYIKYCEEKGIAPREDVLDKIWELVPKRKYVMEFEGEYIIETEKETKKIRVYNDSLSTNPLSLKAAVESVGKPQNTVLICGGLAKGFDFSSIRETLRGLKMAILIGSSADIIRMNFDRYLICGTLEEAIERSIEISDDGDIILFSPGCASFDMFRSAKERGRIFSEKLRCVLDRKNAKLHTLAERR